MERSYHRWHKLAPMTRALLACIALATPLAYAAEPAKEALPGAFKADIAAGQAHEECVKLEKGQSRRYEWRSNVALDFNIHYHQGNEVFYPVKRDSAKRSRGTFKAKESQDYCWMWSAKSLAKLEGRIRP